MQTDDEQQSDSMLVILEQLADEVRSIHLLAAQAADHGDRLLAIQVACHLEWVLGELSQRPGALAGEMPWWRDWSAEVHVADGR